MLEILGDVENWRPQRVRSVVVLTGRVVNVMDRPVALYVRSRLALLSMIADEREVAVGGTKQAAAERCRPVTGVGVPSSPTSRLF